MAVLINNTLLAAIDLDGTLLNDDKVVPESAIDFLSYKWPGKIVLVTGRDERDANAVISQLVPVIEDFYLIYEDGQYITRVENGHMRVLATTQFLSDNALNSFQKWAYNLKKNYVVLTTNRKCNVDNSKTSIKHTLKRIYFLLKGNQCSYGNLPEFSINEQAYKIVIGIDKEDAFTIQAELNRFLPKDAYAVFNDNKIEIKNINASKLCALKYLIHELGLSDDECVYFGNDGNDIECLDYYESYAVSNAREDVKKHAKHLTLSNNQNGVVEALKSIMEERKPCQ